MTEEISTKLSHIRELRVVSPSSVARFKGSQRDPQDIGRELQARYLLVGSVRKAGNQIRINVQLIDSSAGFQVWADDFVGELKDVFSLQDQTALKIAQALNLHLSPQEQEAVQRRYTQNPQAYEAFLVGRALLEHEQTEQQEAARKDFEQALKLDPNYAPALAGLSHVEGKYYRDIDSDPLHLQRAEQFARRALAIDPELADAHAALGRTYALRYDYPRAVEEFRETIRLEPENVLGWTMLSWALGYQQPPDPLEAEKAAREAIRLLPSLPAAQYHLGRALLFQGRYEEATEAFQRSEETGTRDFVDLGMAQVSLAQGNHDQALSYLLKRGGSALSVSSAFSYLICNNSGGELRWLVSPVRWRPAAEGMVFLAGLAGPAVDAVEGKPDGVDVDERQQNDAKPDEHTEATEVAPSQSGDGKGDEDLSRRRHRGCLGSKCQKAMLPAARKMAMRKRLMSMAVV